MGAQIRLRTRAASCPRGSFPGRPPPRKSLGDSGKDRGQALVRDFFPMEILSKEVKTMPGKRMPTAVVKANGKKHLSKAEEAERLAQEVQVDAPEEIRPPKWLPKKYHGEFWEIANILAGLKLYAELDRDVLAQYFVCRNRWLDADKQAAKAIKAKDEKQARQCAEAMGLSVTSRCRLVIPDAGGQSGDEDNPFMALIRGNGEHNG